MEYRKFDSDTQKPWPLTQSLFSKIYEYRYTILFMSGISLVFILTLLK